MPHNMKRTRDAGKSLLDYLHAVQQRDGLSESISICSAAGVLLVVRVLEIFEGLFFGSVPRSIHDTTTVSVQVLHIFKKPSKSSLEDS